MTDQISTIPADATSFVKNAAVKKALVDRPKGWKMTTLGEVARIKHGFAFSGENITSIKNRNVLLTPGNFLIGGGWKDGKKYFNGEVPADYILHKGDLIVTMTDLSKKGDTLGSPALVPDTKNRYLHNQRVGLVMVDEKKVSKDYLYFLMRFPEYQKFIVNASTGSTVKHTSPTRIESFGFAIPSLLSEQRGIAAVLSSLDDKIELLREQNKTLEATVQAIFKEWFVNFNFPLPAEASAKEGGPTRKMVDSELGRIPEGWRVVEMSDLIEVKDGTHDSPKQSQEGHYLITSRHLNKGGLDLNNAYLISDKDFVSINKRSKVETYDILISMIGTVGLLYFVLDKNIDFAIKNVGLFKTSQNKEMAEYVYLFLNSKVGLQYIQGSIVGTTQSYVSLTVLRKIPIVIPQNNIVKIFNKLTQPIFCKIYNNNSQIQTLSALRDGLLPKLMKGEVRVGGFKS